MRSIVGSLISLCLVLLKLLVVNINMWLKLWWNYWTSILFAVMSGDIAFESLCPKHNTSYAGTWFKPTQAIQIPPAQEVMPIIGDNLSARQRECEDAPRRAAKELRWQAWSTAWKYLEDGQWRISCVSSTHLYMSPKKRDEEIHSRWVSMICLAKYWQNAFCQTSVKWYAPTSKTGSTAMGDLQWLHMSVFLYSPCTSVLSRSTHSTLPLISNMTWL